MYYLSGGSGTVDDDHLKLLGDNLVEVGGYYNNYILTLSKLERIPTVCFKFCTFHNVTFLDSIFDKSYLFQECVFVNPIFKECEAFSSFATQMCIMQSLNFVDKHYQYRFTNSHYFFDAFLDPVSNTDALVENNRAIIQGYTNNEEDYEEDNRGAEKQGHRFWET